MNNEQNEISLSDIYREIKEMREDNEKENNLSSLLSFTSFGASTVLFGIGILIGVTYGSAEAGNIDLKVFAWVIITIGAIIMIISKRAVNKIDKEWKSLKAQRAKKT